MRSGQLLRNCATIGSGINIVRNSKFEGGLTPELSTSSHISLTVVLSDSASGEPWAAKNWQANKLDS